MANPKKPGQRHFVKLLKRPAAAGKWKTELIDNQLFLHIGFSARYKDEATEQKLDEWVASLSQKKADRKPAPPFTSEDFIINDDDPIHAGLAGKPGNPNLDFYRHKDGKIATIPQAELIAIFTVGLYDQNYWVQLGYKNGQTAWKLAMKHMLLESFENNGDMSVDEKNHDEMYQKFKKESEDDEDAMAVRWNAYFERYHGNKKKKVQATVPTKPKPRKKATLTKQATEKADDKEAHQDELE